MLAGAAEVEAPLELVAEAVAKKGERNAHMVQAVVEECSRSWVAAEAFSRVSVLQDWEVVWIAVSHLRQVQRLEAL